MANRPSNYPGSSFVSEPSYERPVLAGWVETEVSLNQFLTTEALMAGFELREITFALAGDPWYLYDSKGRIVKEWLLRPPSLSEVREICEALMKL